VAKFEINYLNNKEYKYKYLSSNNIMKTIKTVTFLLFLCLSLAGNIALAVPAVPWPIEKTQPDGSKITVYLRGDEKVSWMESLDGYTLMYDNQKYVVYAELDAEMNMVPSKNRYSPSATVPAGIGKGIHYSPLQKSMLTQIWEINEQASSTEKKQLRSATAGIRYRAICALVESPGKRLTWTKGMFTDLLNQRNYSNHWGAKGSVRDFYLENSYGELDLEITVAGPYMLPKELTYYGEPAPGYNNRDQTERRYEFAKAAADLTFNDPNINPAHFDNNGDGTIDAFHIIFAFEHSGQNVCFLCVKGKFQYGP
jgi:hypothetical protein